MQAGVLSALALLLTAGALRADPPGLAGCVAKGGGHVRREGGGGRRVTGATPGQRDRRPAPRRPPGGRARGPGPSPTDTSESCTWPGSFRERSRTVTAASRRCEVRSRGLRARERTALASHSLLKGRPGATT